MFNRSEKPVQTSTGPEATETQIIRTDAPAPRFSLLERMFVERGDKSDWNLLHDLHYKGESLPIGPRFWKLTLDNETIGVLVTGNPKGMIKERHLVFKKLKPGSGDTKVTNTYRYKFINAHFRVISRFVVDTMYRGIGVGYRTMNLVSRMEGNTFMEIQSSMSKFNMFGQKAGFSFVKPMNANKYEIGLKFFRSHFAASPQDFEAVLAEIESKPPVERASLVLACKEFYFRHSALENTGRNRENAAAKFETMNARTVIKAIQQMVLASPMYGVWRNPDKSVDIPQRLPLSAFSTQGVAERFAG